MFCETISSNDVFHCNFRDQQFKSKNTQTGVIFLSFSKQVPEVVMLDEEVHSAHPIGYDTGKW